MWLLIPVSSFSATLRICPSGCPYTTFSDAQLDFHSGDRIEIQGGTYNENIDLGGAVNLDIYGGYNSSFTSRDTVNNKSIFTNFRLNSFHSGSVTVDGLGFVGSSSQGVVTSTTSSSLYLRNCTVHDSISFGIYAYYVNNLTVEDCTVYSNGDYGGISTGTHGLTGQAIIRRNLVFNHTCTSCVGIYVQRADDDDIIEENETYNNKTGIYVQASAGVAPQVLRNKVYSNTNGISLWLGDDVVRGNVSVQNVVDGIVFYKPGTASIANNVAADNGSAGLHIYGNNAGPFDIVNNIFTGNGYFGLSITGSIDGYSSSNAVVGSLKYNMLASAVGGAFLHNGLAPAYSYNNEISGDYNDMNQFAWSDGNMRVDPGFNDPEAFDYSLRATSFAIDEGDPDSDFSNEPSQNGGRINIGYDGGTSTARTSPTLPTITNLVAEQSGNNLSITFDTNTASDFVWVTAEINTGSGYTTIPQTSLSGTDVQNGYKALRVTSGNNRTITFSNIASTYEDQEINDARIKLTLEKGNNTVTAVSSTFSIDYVDPSVAITSPTNNSDTDLSAPNVIANALDDGSGIANVQFEYREVGSGSYLPINTDSSAPFMISWGSILLQHGKSYEIRATALDNAGNSSVAIVRVNINPVNESEFTVSIQKEGKGGIIASVTGATCGQNCDSKSVSVTSGTIMTFTASPDTGYTFSGWSGDSCTGVGICQVTISSDTIVKATFSPLESDDERIEIHLSSVGDGNGNFSLEPKGRKCGEGCYSYKLTRRKLNVVVSAKAARNSQVVWDSGCLNIKERATGSKGAKLRRNQIAICQLKLTNQSLDQELVASFTKK